jgi:hypothetical protein
MEMKIKVKGSPIELVDFYNKLMNLTPTIKVNIETDDILKDVNNKKELILNKYNDYLLSLNLDPSKFQYDKERNTGYFGLVTSDDFISGKELSEFVKFEKGELLKYDTLWAVFYCHGKIAITPIKPIRYNVSWDDINELGLIDNGFNRMNIKGNHYSISLHTGDVEKTNTWDELLSRLHIDSKITPTWDSLDDVDLNVNWEVCEHGTATWCQETSSGAPKDRIHRGTRLAFSGMNTSSTVNTDMAWRPLLILN